MTSNNQGGGSGGNFHKHRNSSSHKSNLSFHIPLEPMKDSRRMDPQERIFLEAAERGDKHTIIRCLQGSSPVNVNATNMMGRSAIQIAVDNENVEIVELLLKQEGVQIGDALLYAIREGVYRIVEMLIDHPSISREMLGSEWSKQKPPGEESSDYSPDISPVILAAHCNQFEILQLLLSRGARIERPHALLCSCHKCRINIQSDSLRHSLLRIHTYRALASPAWISLTSPDPVLTAFKLSWELEHLASRENEFKDIYVELSDSCKAYTCSLLDQCRSSEEVIAVLNKESDSEDEEDEVDLEYLQLSRLKLALKYEQKQFVAHPHCQQLLASIWYEGIPGWRKHTFVTKVLIIVLLIIAMPFMAVYYLVFPRSRLGELIRTPFMKFMYHSASFGVFLLLLVMASTNISAAESEKQIRQEQRGPPPSALETLVCFYVFGFIWAECKQMWDEGMKAYVRQWWNWLDFIMLSLYLCTFSLRVVAFFQTFNEEKYGNNIMARSDWPSADPTLVSEGVFAIANVFSFARIIYLFQANPQLGPLQISLGCMLIDIGKFLFIFFLVLISFACGLNQLYYYYSASDHVDVGNTTVVGMVPDDDKFENAFDPLIRALTTLFWSMFGLIAISTLNMYIPLVDSFGKVLFGMYHISAKILLLNMLIAMMSKSFHTIVDHADREWKFARSKLWMGYFDEGSTLPPPFNLIVSPKSIYYISLQVKEFLQTNVLGRKTSFANSGSRRKSRSMDGNIRVNAAKSPEVSVIAFANNHAEGGNIMLPLPATTYELPDDGNDQQSNLNHRLHHGSGANLSLEDVPTDFTTSFSHPSSMGSLNEAETTEQNGGTMNSKTVKPHYQDVMRRLVSRYIHHWKIKLRQDGVNEDDLLEIKQDISSLRYELREDRKRESARTTGHIDNLKRDVLRSIRASSLGVPQTHAPHSTGGSLTGGGPNLPGTSNLSPSTGRSPVASPSHSAHQVANTSFAGVSAGGGILDAADIEFLKQEISNSLRNELRAIAREIVISNSASSSVAAQNHLAMQQNNLLPPQLSSELYQTHLYTQL